MVRAHAVFMTTMKLTGKGKFHRFYSYAGHEYVVHITADASSLGCPDNVNKATHVMKRREGASKWQKCPRQAAYYLMRQAEREHAAEQQAAAVEP